MFGFGENAPWWFVGVWLAATLPAQESAVPAHVDQFVQDHCVTCHGEDKVKGALDLTVPAAGPVEALWRWSRMRERVQAYEMPPIDASEVTPAERLRFVDWVEELLQREVPELPEDPGRVTVRRLSRGQWQNAITDLFGVAAPIAGLPADDLGYGFDSIGDALTFSTLHLEKYLAAAKAVAREVFHGEGAGAPAERHFAAGAMQLVGGRGATMRGDHAHMFTRATVRQVVELPRAGRYRLQVIAAGQLAGSEPPRMRLSVDGREVRTFDVDRGSPMECTFELPLPGGRRTFAISFVNDYYDPKNPDPAQRDRNLRVDELVVTGPVDPRPEPAQQAWLRAGIRGRDDAAKLRTTVRTLLPKLWRRRPTAAELRRLQRAGRQRLRDGASLAEAQRYVLTAALVSPHFLFRIERGRLSATDLAVRLSFFLWASVPDDELLRYARAGGFEGEEDGWIAQVDRMLADPRARRLASDFAAQWLELRALEDLTPDPERLPGFDRALRASLRRQTELLFLTVLREGRDVRELLDCGFTHVDARLAGWYGLPHEGPAEEFVRVRLVGAARVRGGLLGHAAIHAITSNPTRTSPVRRGKWILDNLLGQAPPPPPPGNGAFADEARIDDAKTLREQMAQHRERSKCAVCHVRMDMFGLAMERFDAIGRFRRADGGGEIDASGVLPDGRRLDGLQSLKDLLVADPAFVRTLLHKLFRYAVGRDLRPVDRLRIDLAARRLWAQPVITLRDLILVIVRDPAFRRQSAVD